LCPSSKKFYKSLLYEMICINILKNIKLAQFPLININNFIIYITYNIIYYYIFITY